MEHSERFGVVIAAIAALQLADRAVIIDHGQVVFTGTAAEVLGNAELRASYLAV